MNNLSLVPASFCPSDLTFYIKISHIPTAAMQFCTIVCKLPTFVNVKKTVKYLHTHIYTNGCTLMCIMITIQEEEKNPKHQVITAN